MSGVRGGVRHGEGAERPGRGERRRALARLLWAGGLWSVGNGLTTGTLVSYLAQDLGASGAQVGLILALPALVGVLRLAAPWAIRAAGSAKRACLLLCGCSYALLALLPGLAWGDHAFWPVRPLLALVVLLCAHQLLEHVGNVAFWAWMAEVVPRRVRGRFFGRRQAWQLAVLVPTLLASGWFADSWRKAYPQQGLVAYAVPNGVGAVALLGSLVPLARVRASFARGSKRRSGDVWQPEERGAALDWRQWLAPLRDGAFVRLLVFACWVAASNGLTQTAQNVYPKAVLALGVLPMDLLRMLTRVLQMLVSPWVGLMSDRYGNRRVLLAAQGVIVWAPLFYLLATPAAPWWMVGAWISFAGFAGHNLCQPNLMLALAADEGPGAVRAAHIAWYWALQGVAFAVATLAGGWLFDRLASRGPWTFGGWSVSHYAVLFGLGLVLRLAGVPLAGRLWDQRSGIRHPTRGVV